MTLGSPGTARPRPHESGRPAITALAIGSFFSIAGDQVATLSLALHATEHRSGALVSTLFIAQLLPGVLLGAVGGRFVDRHNLRRVQITSLAAQAGSIGSAALVPGLWTKAAFVAVSYCFGVLSSAASFRTRRHLFGGRTKSVNGILGSAASVGNVTGTAAAGIGVALLGLRALLAADAASFIVLAVAVARVTAPQKALLIASPTPERPASRSLVPPELKLLSSPTVFGSVGLALVVMVVVSTSFEGVVCLFYLHDVAGLHTSAIGFVLAFWPIGIAVCSALIARSHAHAARTILPIAAIGIGSAIAATSELVEAPLIAASYFVAGLGNGAFSVSLANVVHDGAPQEQLGATWAVLGSILNAGFLVGVTLGGFGAAHPRTVMAAAGLTCAASGSIALAVTRARRRPTSDAQADRDQ
jgi:MFS family permease